MTRAETTSLFPIREAARSAAANRERPRYGCVGGKTAPFHGARGRSWPGESHCHSLILPKPVSSASHEYVLERRLRQCHRFDHTRKGLDHLGNKRVAGFLFYSKFVVNRSWLNSKFGCNHFVEIFGVMGGN